MLSKARKTRLMRNGFEPQKKDTQKVLVLYVRGDFVAMRKCLGHQSYDAKPFDININARLRNVIAQRPNVCQQPPCTFVDSARGFCS